MNQVIVGVFASWRDGHDALRALQSGGLRRDDAHLYRATGHHAAGDALFSPVHGEDDAEYIAHGELQGISGAHNRLAAPAPTASDMNDRSWRGRTLLVIKITKEIKPNAVGDLLYDYGALAVKDATGHWRFSPFRKAVRA